jgi:hypothetical protein
MRQKMQEYFDPTKTIQPTGKYLVLDYFPIPHWIAINAIAGKYLQETLGSTLAAFGFTKPYKETRNLYSAVEIDTHLQIKVKFTEILRLRKTYFDIVKSLKDSEDIYTLTIEGLQIGIPIYESILRSGRKTVQLNDSETYEQIFRAVLQYTYFKSLFEAELIDAVLVSHDCYIGPGLLDHMAHKFGVPSININPFEINLPHLPHQLYQRFNRYPIYFDSLPPKEQERGLAIASHDLDARLNGEVGVKMGYQLESAFEESELPRQLESSGHTKVLVATHDFYDNPHAYGGMLFEDFYKWLEFLSNIAEETSYHWYLKCHKDADSDQLRIIEDFSKSHPRFKVINRNTSFHQLVEEGLDFVLTCYGSVGHEIPLLGVQVVNSSYNPHIGYGFNHHAVSKEDYRDMLMRLPLLRDKPINQKDVYEFFYVHHYLMYPDDLILPSYSSFIQAIDGKLQSNESMDYFLDNYGEIASKIRGELERALTSRRVFSVERNLKPELQLRVPITQRNQEFFEKFKSH